VVQDAIVAFVAEAYLTAARHARIHGRVIMPDHVDRTGSKAAIAQKIAEEWKHIAELEKRKKEREKDKLPVDHLDREIEDEHEKIRGKKKILDIVDDFGQMDAVDKEIAGEEAWLADAKKALEKLRGEEPKPRELIDKLAGRVRDFEKCIEGKKIAKGAILYD
jgi:predicted  nucleic acid-binding Zn-ribbon protein